MMPALALVGSGTRRRWTVPIPLFLLWPLVALAAGVLEVLVRLPFGDRTTREKVFAVRAAVRLFFSLSGLHVEVKPRSGSGFYLRLL